MDDELAKIIRCFEGDKGNINYANRTERGYLMNQGVLYRYAHDSESEYEQLVVPIHGMDTILKEHHGYPTTDHYGAEGTFNRIAKRYYWTGMRKFTTDYVKNCIYCNR